MEIDPTSLPHLSKQLRDQKNRQKTEQIEIQNFKKKSFLVIAHNGSHGFGPDLVGIFPRSLPQLSKQLRDQNNTQKRKTTFYEKNKK